MHAVLNTKLMEGFYLKRPSSAAAVLKHGYFVGTESSLHMCRHCVVCVSLHAGLDRVIVAVIDTGVELASSGVGAAVWANAAEVAGDGVDNDGNGAYAWAVVSSTVYAWTSVGRRAHGHSHVMHTLSSLLTCTAPADAFIVLHHPRSFCST